jgi:hypothetical protein
MESNFLKIVLGIAAGFLLCLHTIEPKAQALYGPQGQYLGNIQQSGNTANYYGPQGQYQGSAQTSGNQVNFYGAAGQYQGTYQAPQPTPYTPYIPAQPVQPIRPWGY